MRSSRGLLSLVSWASVTEGGQKGQGGPFRSRPSAMVMFTAEEEQKALVSYEWRIAQVGFRAQVSHAGASLL